MPTTSTADDNYVKLRFTVDKSSSSDFSDGSMGYSSSMETTFNSEMFIAQDLVATQVNTALDANGEPIVTDEFPGAVLIDMQGTKNIKSAMVKNKSSSGTVKVVWTGPTSVQKVASDHTTIADGSPLWYDPNEDITDDDFIFIAGDSAASPPVVQEVAFDTGASNKISVAIDAEQFGQVNVPAERYLILADMQDDSVLAVQGDGEDVPVEIIIFGE
tara:strand:- start:33 stop:680 length:648 start_codon:yes stop_codon:yes gene_type:complete